MKIKILALVAFVGLALFGSGCSLDYNRHDKQMWAGSVRPAAGSDDGSVHSRSLDWRIQDPVHYALGLTKETIGLIGGIIDIDCTAGPASGSVTTATVVSGQQPGQYYSYVYSCWVPNGCHVQKCYLNGSWHLKPVPNGCRTEIKVINGQQELVIIRPKETDQQP
ncbi:MAG TPA: hypothetical protein VL335_03160 [Candidatus Paceibacterota bacterium]|jgi:hypothetical protein|nr:hypothetical protein [Candidatus Paceibacterota bacterium]